MLLQCLRIVHTTFFTIHLQWKFGEALCLSLFFFFFFFKKFFLEFRIVAIAPGGIVAIVVTVFFGSSVCNFFSYIYIYIVILTQQISQLLRCQFLISQNKIINYETVTNHN